MSKPTVATLSAEIVELRAELEVLRAQFAELDARQINARPAAAARPVAATKVDADPKGRSAPIFARDAAYALGNVLNTKCWVQPVNGKFRVTKGPEPLPADEMTASELMDYVRQVRAAAMPMAA